MPYLLRRVPRPRREMVVLPRPGWHVMICVCYIIHFAGQLVLISEITEMINEVRSGRFSAPFKAPQGAAGSHCDIWSIQFGSSQLCGRENIWNAFTWMKWILIQSFQSIASGSTIEGSLRVDWWMADGYLGFIWLRNASLENGRTSELLCDGWMSDWIQLTVREKELGWQWFV